MRILWITNRPIASAQRKYDIRATSGTWMEPALDTFSKNGDIVISVATVAPVSSFEEFSENGITYYCVPQSRKRIYPHNSKKNKGLWQEVISRSKPDIIMVWGTEYAHGYCALKQAGDIPSVIYTQGILDSVARYYFGGMTNKELSFAVTFRNIIKHDTIRMQRRLYEKKAKIEKKMLELSGRAIVNTYWAGIWCRQINPQCEIYTCQIGINEAFYDTEWKIEECNRRTVFCSAPSGYPLKGLHNIIKAMSVIVKKYPDAKLKVPGMTNPYNDNIFSVLKRQGYVKYIMSLIDRFSLKENVEFLGKLTPQQMAEQMKSANAFVVASSIENESCTLREAMMVGTPSIASYVGAVPEIVCDGKNAYLYRFEEYEMLADRILKIFNDDVLATSLSVNARNDMREIHNEDRKNEMLYNIYKQMIGETN